MVEDNEVQEKDMEGIFDETHTYNSGHAREASHEDDEDPRPAKRRRSCTMPSDIAEISTCEADSEASSEPFADHSLPQGQDEMHIAESPSSCTCSPLRIGDGHSHTLSASRSPSAVTVLLTAEYDERPVQGFFKRTRIGDQVLCSLEFSLEHVPDRLKLSVTPESLGVNAQELSTESPHSSCFVIRSKADFETVLPQRKRITFTRAENALLIGMKEERDLSWDEIETAFPNRSKATLQVHYSTKLKGRSTSTATKALPLKLPQRHSTRPKS
jgi:hypothetical protein